MSQQVPSSPHLGHQSSLENTIDFSTELPLNPNVRNRFYRITDHFQVTEPTVHLGSRRTDTEPPYNRPRLIRLTYDHARSSRSQDKFLRAFFTYLELPLELEGETQEDVLDDQVRSRFLGFADYLVNNFFLPIKAATHKTPQHSPAFHSAIQRLQDGVEFAGTPERLSALRGACLIRDHHRCVVTRKFDRYEMSRRYGLAGDDARDDDGNLLSTEATFAMRLEVCHILPHSLTSVRRGEELPPSKQAALAILNMFDHGVGHLIEGTNIDRPGNALTLDQEMHLPFGNFDIVFEPVQGAEPNTYRIECLLPPPVAHGLSLPITRTLLISENRTIDPPSPRLLAIHRAIGYILHMSAAGDYIDEIFREAEESWVQGAKEDGSTDVGRLVHLGLWLDGVGAKGISALANS